MELTEILPGRTDRAVLVGMTGSGKTTLAEQMLKFSRFVAVYDAKGLLRWDGYERYRSLKGVTDSNAEKIIYSPSFIELRDFDFIDAFFAWVYQRGNCTAYIDEVYSVTKGPNLPLHYHACLTRGREKGVELLSATQRPMSIPNVILSESEHYYIFRLSMPNDRKKIEQTVALSEERIQALKKREFFYASAEDIDLGPQGPLILDLPSKSINEVRT
jgi:hypothetical protein